ncbi:4-amino-4-deoxy-L-arabinose transferase [Dyella sp. OK004]|uniref:ArnT family glycosyltransferase n=1 Tax=Dyella sp. OK004 TaxID=1855292 RepID=UPI0008ECF134|nr:glycosyltransferase family 39 protein [Dyella sp. OK004]SFS18584.1 4-amino-4-deoxy-L-arabinose transferase [Dyella sp. OK004]
MHSTRALSVAWEMWHRHSFMVPYLNGAPYSDKVPLLFWLIHLGWAVGVVNDVWPRLLEVALGGTQLVLVATLARRLFPERPEIARTTPWVLLALTYGFLFGLQIMYEVLLSVCVLAALLALVPSPRREAPRFAWFALAMGLGLLAKGPVMLLHVAFPWLLGPLWSDWAQRERRRWYGQGALAMLAGLGLLLAWALTAAWVGGEAYRNQLLFHQTAGRVVDAFAHAAPFWWYVPLLPVLIFPFALWPRLWVAVGILRRPFEPGLRFVFCWLGPVLLGFSIISGKQPYYLLPEYAAFALLIAAALLLLRQRHLAWVDSAWLGPWPLGLLGVGFGLALILLPYWVRSGAINNAQLTTIAPHSAAFGVLYLLLGALLLVPGKNGLYRIACAGLIGVVAANGLFTLTLWPAYDFAHVATLIGNAERHGQPVANIGSNDGQFNFLGRLTRPITPLRGEPAIKAWAAAHPDGLIVTYPRQLTAADRNNAVYIQPFRGVWLTVWPAPALAASGEEGGTAPE